MKLHPIPSRFASPKDLLSSEASTEIIERKLSGIFGKTAVLLSSARIGLYLILASKGLRRTDEIYVPNYLSQCVLNTINRTAFPTHSQTGATKAVLVLHQWGYPQKMGEVLRIARKNRYLVIEDCAHSMTSKYDAKTIGLFGDAAIFSFPKLFPTLMGGFLLSDDKEIIDFSRRYRNSRNSVQHQLTLNRMIKIVYANLVAGESKRSELVRQSLEKCYAIYNEYPQTTTGLNGLIDTAISNVAELKKRAEHLAQYHETFTQNISISLEEDSTVVPYFVPFFDSEPKLKRIAVALGNAGVECSIMHFDVNRNVFDCNYVNCLALPCHQELTHKEIAYICSIIRVACANE
jgi:dTDP-4-amino-4,6-dideoxygalactose transaminase